MSKITLVSSTGDKIQVNKDICQMSNTLNNLCEENPDGTEDIPVPGSTNVLQAFVEYAEHYEFKKMETTIVAPLQSTDPEVWCQDEWERKFITSRNDDQIKEMLEFSNYLSCTALFELCVAFIAADYKKTEFDEFIKNNMMDEGDFTPEEEAELIADHKWILEQSEERIKKMKEDMGGI